MDNYIFNKCQTSLEELRIDQYPKEVQEDFFNFLNNVPFIRWMVSPKRPLVSQLPRDEYGRAIIDVTQPPILENTEFFRQTAKVWEETGHYTHLRPNVNPQSDFGKWFLEEKRRGWEGLVDPSTGMWVTGDYYWMLNYCPMHLVVKRKDGLALRTTKHPRFWDGQFFVTHYILQSRLKGHHAAYLASRGRGKTSLAAGMLSRRFEVGESFENKQEVQCMVTAADRTKLAGTNQILDVFVDYIDFIAKNTQFDSRRSKSSLQELSWEMGFKKSGSDVIYGSKNSVSGIISGVNQDKLNGSRGVLYLVEEAGIFKNLTEMYNMIRPSVEFGGDVFGLILLYGTAGSDESDFTAFAEMFYSPEGYNLNGLPNVFDKEGQGRKECCMFYPAYLNYDASCMDENGNSDVTKALLNICMDRYKVKYGSSDINTIVKRISQYPIVPQEAIIRSQGNVFPVTDLNERLNQIDNDPSFYDDTYVGELVQNSEGKVEFKPTTDIPIRDFPTKDNKIVGALEIYEMPRKNAKEEIPYDRYIISLDPFDSDTANTMSLGSCLVMDLWTDTIVAEYTGRPFTAEDLYERVRKLCLFYNAKCMYENNLKGCFGYFSKMNCLHLLADTPTYLKDRQVIKEIGWGNKAKGIHATTPVINSAFTMINSWLKKGVTKITKDENGNEVETTIPNLYNLKNRALIKELIQWNPYQNYDRCVLGDTQIQTASGIKEIQYITFDDKVLTISGEYNSVCQLHKNYFDGRMYKFRALGDYRYLNCTYNHPIACRHKIGKGGEKWMETRNEMSLPEYKDAQYITDKDFVLVPKRINLSPCLLSDDKLYLLGWYIADGNISTNNVVRFTLQGDQYEIAKDIKRLLDKYWARDYTFIKESTRQWRDKKIIQPAHNKKGHVEARIVPSYAKYKGKRVNAWNVIIASKEAQEFFAYYGGTPNHKDIVDELYNTKGLLPLIRGLFEGDGHYRCEVRCDGSLRNSLELSSVYDKLIHKVRQILIDEGIWCTVRRVKKRGLMAREQYNINIVNNQVIPIIQGSLKFKQIIPKHSKTVKEHFIEDDWGFWVKVRDITSYNYSGYVYNIGVENEHNYCANGIATHNCMSLVQLMLYREEKMILYQGDMKKTERPLSAIEKDDYWSKNYPGKKEFSPVPMTSNAYSYKELKEFFSNQY